MDKILETLILATIGFFFGGLMGYIFYSSFSPYCWYGAAAIGLGIIFIEIDIHH